MNELGNPSTRPKGIRVLYADQGPLRSASDVLKAAAKSAFVVRHMSVTLFRCSQILGRKFPAAGLLVKQWNHLLTGADLAWQADVGVGLILHHPTGVVWGPGVKIGADCRVQQGVTIGGRGGSNDDGSPVVGDRVVLGAGSRILGAIQVGDDCIIGANAVVVRDVAAGSTAVGVPAKVLPVRGDTA